MRMLVVSRGAAGDGGMSYIYSDKGTPPEAKLQRRGRGQGNIIMAADWSWKEIGLGVVAGLATAGALTLAYRILTGGNARSGGRPKIGRLYKMNDSLALYIKDRNRENEALERLRAATMQHLHANMATGLDVGRLLSTLCRAVGAKKAVDVGVFTGCSTMAMALSLPPDGKVIACDISEEYVDIGKPYWKEGGVADKIDLRIKPATETLQELLDGGEAGTFDVVFIDADKLNYGRYYDFSLQLLRPGGLVIVDNALWSGRVADSGDQSEHTKAIRTLNDRMSVDPNVEYVLLTVSDGIGIACKL